MQCQMRPVLQEWKDQTHHTSVTYGRVGNCVHLANKQNLIPLQDQADGGNATA